MKLYLIRRRVLTLGLCLLAAAAMLYVVTPPPSWGPRPPPAGCPSTAWPGTRRWPPYGEYDDKVITAVRALGMEPIQWDVDSLDWQELSADEITRRVTSKVQPGSIILFHNAALHTPEALPGIIEALLKDGYTLLPVSELLLPGTYNTDYTIDHTGRQMPAA